MAGLRNFCDLQLLPKMPDNVHLWQCSAQQCWFALCVFGKQSPFHTSLFTLSLLCGRAGVSTSIASLTEHCFSEGGTLPFNEG